MSLRLLSSIVETTSISNPLCLHCLSSRAQPLRSQVSDHVTRRFRTGGANASLKRKLTRTRKFLYGLGMLSFASGGAYQFVLTEPQRRKVRVTMGGFVRFFRYISYIVNILILLLTLSLLSTGLTQEDLSQHHHSVTFT